MNGETITMGNGVEKAQPAGRAETVAQVSAYDDARLRVEELTVYYGKTPAVKHVSMSIKTRKVTAIIGPSGCGNRPFCAV